MREWKLYKNFRDFNELNETDLFFQRVPSLLMGLVVAYSLTDYQFNHSRKRVPWNKMVERYEYAIRFTQTILGFADKAEGVRLQ